MQTNFVLVIINRTMSAPTLANVTLAKAQWAERYTLTNDLPITANGMLVGKAVITDTSPGVSAVDVQAVDVQYDAVPGTESGGTVAVQFGVAMLSDQPQAFLGATPSWGLKVEVVRVPVDTYCLGVVTIGFENE